MMRVTLFTLLVLAAPAAADDANRLFEQGRAEIKDGNYAAGCALLEQSYELERAPGTQLNLGECAEHAGKLRSAWLLYDAAAREYARTDRPKQAEFARKRADALAPRLAKAVDVPKLARAGAASPAPARPLNPWRPAAYAGAAVTTLSLATFGFATAALMDVGGGNKCAPEGEPQTQFACRHGVLLVNVGNVASWAFIAGAVFTGVAIYKTRKRDATNRSLFVTPAVSSELTGIRAGARW